MSNNSTWKLIGHSHQIADTGDYDGRYEITNGKISIFTQDDDDEALDTVVSALNDSGCRFYLDDWAEFENRLLKDEISQLKAERDLLKAQLDFVENQMTDGEVEDAIAVIMQQVGPDGHIDGYDYIAAFTISLLYGNGKEWLDDFLKTHK